MAHGPQGTGSWKSKRDKHQVKKPKGPKDKKLTEGQKNYIPPKFR
jgi:hypothetical protein